MDWHQAFIVIDRFERITQDYIKDLKQLHLDILENKRIGGSASVQSDKRRLKCKIDQLLSNLFQILELRTKLNDSDIEKFDLRIEPTRIKIQSVVNSLQSIHSLVHPERQDSSNIYGDMYEANMATDSSAESTQYSIDKIALRLKSEQARRDAEVHKKLAMDIEDLNTIMVDLANLVHEQHDVVDSIEEHIEKSQVDLQLGHINLKKAHAAQTAKYPLMAAILGSVAIGGPVGVAAGSTVAGICAAVGGAIAGLYGGRLIKREVRNAPN